MNYNFTEEEIMVRDTAREIAREKILPVRQKYDEEGIFPEDIVKIMAEGDLFRVFIPQEYDGLGLSMTAMLLAVEELSYACAGIALSYAGTSLGTVPIVMFGSEEQKRKYLPLVAGGGLAAFALTEAEAGSDAGGVKTRAVKDGDSYILNGTKQFITNGGVADFYVIIAITDPTRGTRGATAFIVDKGTPGLEFGKKENKMGIRASATRELVLRNLRVPASQILGREGNGFLMTMKVFDKTRLGVAAQSLGIAQAALDAAILYAKEREQFGKPIATFQGLQFMMADMAMKIEAGRALTYAAAKDIDLGGGDPKITAMAKAFTSDTAMAVTVDALQIMGGYGYMKEYPLEKMMRDAKITQIYEGTNQVMRSIIASHLIKETK